jgi:hypothetical protein
MAVEPDFAPSAANWQVVEKGDEEELPFFDCLDTFAAADPDSVAAEGPDAGAGSSAGGAAAAASAPGAAGAAAATAAAASDSPDAQAHATVKANAKWLAEPGNRWASPETAS